MDDASRVVEARTVPERGADDQDRQEVPRGRDHAGERDLDGVEQHVLEEQVLDRVTGQAELGEDRDRDAPFAAAPRRREDRLGVRGRVRDAGPDHAGRHTGEAVAIDRRERGSGGLGHAGSIGHPGLHAKT